MSMIVKVRFVDGSIARFEEVQYFRMFDGDLVVHQNDKITRIPIKDVHAFELF